MEKKKQCCTPEGQIKRYVDCVGCDKKPMDTMSDKKQSSIDWLEQQLNAILKQSNIEIENVIWQQAKEIHKKEILKACARGYVNASDGFPLQEAINYAEQYYNETFEK